MAVPCGVHLDPEAVSLIWEANASPEALVFRVDGILKAMCGWVWAAATGALDNSAGIPAGAGVLSSGMDTVPSAEALKGAVDSSPQSKAGIGSVTMPPDAM